MKNINVKVEDRTLEELRFIQEYYSDRLGIKLSQRQVLIKLLNETANLIKNTGETYPNRDWSIDRQFNISEKGERNG